MTFAQINNITYHYRFITSESAQTFVFINSLGTDFRIWEEVVELLKNHGSILLYDKRGHGLTDTASASSLEDYAADAEALINHLKIESCVIIGLSVGGMIAQLLAKKIPQKITHLILCDTCHKIGTTDSWNNRIATVKEHGLTAVADGVMQRWFSATSRADKAKVNGYKNMLERTPALGYMQACKAIRDADLTTTAQQITTPTVCIAGSEDQSTTPAEVKELAGLIKGAQFKVIEDSGHLPCVDNPQALSQLIIDFIHQPS